MRADGLKNGDDKQKFFAAFEQELGNFLSLSDAENGEDIRLAVQLASRQIREGHVCVDLSDFAGKAYPQDGADGEPISFPELTDWMQTLKSASCVGRPGEFQPLILDDAGRLYFQRYWQYEKDIADFLIGCIGFSQKTSSSAAVVRKKLADYFPEAYGGHYMPPALAAVLALLQRLIVITGSPGTGKTTAVTKILAFLLDVEQKPLRIVFCAPTGKAASRLEESIRKNKNELVCAEKIKQSIPDEAMTLHRLLRSIPYSPYFFYEKNNPLPYDVVVVDEASMVDLPLAAKLLDALLPDARLFMLGDKDQLASVEPGAVLGNICYPEPLNVYSTAFARKINELSGLNPESAAGAHGISNCIVELKRNYRFAEKSGIGALSQAVRDGDDQKALALLNEEKGGEISFSDCLRLEDVYGIVRKTVFAFYRPYLDAVQKKILDIDDIFDRLGAFRILCALRVGPAGALKINSKIEKILADAGLISLQSPFYPGRPIMITENDYRLGLFNGDVGIVWDDREEAGQKTVIFRDPQRGPRRMSPERLPKHETVWAMTIHKSQGSEFDRVAVLLPPGDTPLLTREMLYTGITRARLEAHIWGSRPVLAAMIQKKIFRQSGLTDAIRKISAQ